MTKKHMLIIGLGVLLLASVNLHAGTNLPNSVFEEQFQQMRAVYSLAALQAEQSIESVSDNKAGTAPKHHSPGRAFIYSLAVPGLGQYYNESKIKAAGFFLLDVAAISLHFKYQSDGNKKTNEFNKFQQDHWSRNRYALYLSYVYNGKTDDDSISATEISHHLPDTPTQQYYEMTGKYDQFSWGWDDAIYQGKTIGQWGPSPNNMPAITGSSFAPFSDHRNMYETMRFNANHKFSLADRWLIVAIANHVVSAFEAMITARRINGAMGGGVLGRTDVNVNLRSVYSWNDTPYLKLSYAF